VLTACWPGAAAAQLDWRGPDFAGATNKGQLCIKVANKDGERQLKALAHRGKRLAGKVVPSCGVALKPGLPAGVKLVLRARKRRGVIVPVSSSGYGWASRHGTKDHLPEQLPASRLLRRGTGRTLVLQHGRKRVVVARLRPGYVQYFRSMVRHDPQGGVTVRTYVFFGTGLTVGPAQLEMAIYSTKKRRGRLVLRSFNRQDCSDRKRCSAAKGFGPSLGKPVKK